MYARLGSLSVAVVAALSGACASTQEAPEAPPAAKAEPGRPEGDSPQARATRARLDAEEAERAIRAGAADAARGRVEAADGELAALEERLPGAALDAALERTSIALRADPARADFAGLRALAEQERPLLEREVFEAIEDARFALLGGDPERAATRLDDARARLGEDTSRGPVAVARTHLAAALAGLRGAEPAEAAAALDRAGPTLALIERRAPLVPARWSLRRAAAAAEAGSWTDARAELERAVRALDEVRAPPGSAQARAVDDLRGRAEGYLERIEGQRRPSPAELRELASRTSDAAAG